jgi:hypothetical protein
MTDKDKATIDFAALSEKTKAKRNVPVPIDPSVFANDDKRDPYGNSALEGASDAFVIDFATVPKGDEPIPAGTYNATIVHAEPTTSKSSGNPMIALRWRIDDDGEYYHRTLFDQLVFTQSALWRVRQLLEALGYAEDFKGEIKPESLLGESATLQVTIQAGKGVNPETQEPYSPRNSVKKYLPVGTSQQVADLL